MPISHWPETDRPREKLLTKGAHHLTDAELIAVILNTGSRGMNALELARSLLTQQGGLKLLLDAGEQTKGIGQAKFAALQAAVELGKRYLATRIQKGEKLHNSQLTQAFLSDQLKTKHNEVFACLFLDVHLRLIQYEELFQGTLHESHIYPREIVRQCLRHHAAKIILAHNHPSGNPTPSAADCDATRTIREALALIEVQVVDHIIVGSERCYSFAESGLMF